MPTEGMSVWWIEPLRVLWLAFPVMLAAGVHIIVIKKNWLAFLKRPLDGGRTWRGVRVFGDNKTVRGALIMITAAGFGMWLQGIVRLPSLEYFDYGETNLIAGGSLLGLGFVLGELPNSFLKRRRGFAAGQHAGPFFAFLDQVDSVIGVLLLMYVIWTPPLRVWLWALALGSGVHIAFNSVFVLLGLKTSVF